MSFTSFPPTGVDTGDFLGIASSFQFIPDHLKNDQSLV